MRYPNSNTPIKSKDINVRFFVLILFSISFGCKECKECRLENHNPPVAGAASDKRWPRYQASTSYFHASSVMGVTISITRWFLG